MLVGWKDCCYDERLIFEVIYDDVCLLIGGEEIRHLGCVRLTLQQREEGYLRVDQLGRDSLEVYLYRVLFLFVLAPIAAVKKSRGVVLGYLPTSFR